MIIKCQMSLHIYMHSVLVGTYMTLVLTIFKIQIYNIILYDTYIMLQKVDIKINPNF